VRQAARFACVATAGARLPSHESTALTYRGWLGQRLDRYMVSGDLGPARVQFMRRGLKGCGVVLEAQSHEGGKDWFQVRDNGTGMVGWLPGMKVRLCSGDGRCACEDAAAAAGGAPACGVQPAAKAVPPGNTGTTVVEGA
jgi:hypothetical protein